MGAPYPMINATNVGGDISQIFVYANSVTNDLFMPVVVLAFFLIVFIGSLIMQLRFSSRMRPEFSFAAASFATFGLCLILMQANGLIGVSIFGTVIFALIISVLWLVFSRE